MVAGLLGLAAFAVARPMETGPQPGASSDIEDVTIVWLTTMTLAESLRPSRTSTSTDDGVTIIAVTTAPQLSSFVTPTGRRTRTTHSTQPTTSVRAVWTPPHGKNEIPPISGDSKRQMVPLSECTSRCGESYDTCLDSHMDDNQCLTLFNTCWEKCDTSKESLESSVQNIPKVQATSEEEKAMLAFSPLSQDPPSLQACFRVCNGQYVQCLQGGFPWYWCDHPYQACLDICRKTFTPTENSTGPKMLTAVTDDKAASENVPTKRQGDFKKCKDSCYDDYQICGRTFFEVKCWPEYEQCVGNCHAAFPGEGKRDASPEPAAEPPVEKRQTLLNPPFDRCKDSCYDAYEICLKTFFEVKCWPEYKQCVGNCHAQFPGSDKRDVTPEPAVESVESLKKCQTLLNSGFSRCKDECYDAYQICGKTFFEVKCWPEYEQCVGNCHAQFPGGKAKREVESIASVESQADAGVPSALAVREVNHAIKARQVVDFLSCWSYCQDKFSECVRWGFVNCQDPQQQCFAVCGQAFPKKEKREIDGTVTGRNSAIKNARKSC